MTGDMVELLTDEGPLILSRAEHIERLQDEGLNDSEIDALIPGGLTDDERRESLPTFIPLPQPSCWCGFPLRDGRCGMHGDKTTVEATTLTGCFCVRSGGWGPNGKRPGPAPDTVRRIAGSFSVNVCVECGGLRAPTE